MRVRGREIDMNVMSDPVDPLTDPVDVDKDIFRSEEYGGKLINCGNRQNQIELEN